jgi:chromosome segregation ATPase
MSEQESSRIEAQIAELRELMQQNMATTQHDMNAMQQNMNAMQQNMNAVREDVTVLRQRVESIEGTVIVAMREGFNSLHSYLDDLNYEVADNARSTRLLKRRIARLERKDENDR